MQSANENLIKPINSDTVHKICSGQVVFNLAIAVKELLENSLDAGATTIDIRLKNYGTELIEVSDNGTGVTEDNFEALTLKSYTSKINDYSDLLGVTSFGFRGEALSSLCALSNLTITTKHKTAGYATKIEYDHKGHIIKKSPCSRQVGTTVSLTNLFISLPVRQKEFHKNAKREFNKMTQLLYAYCLISSGVKISCSNQTSANSRSVVVATHGSMSYKDNIACVFGVKQLQNILEMKPEYVQNIKDNIFKGLSGEFIQGEDETIEDVEINLSEDSNDTDIKESQDSIPNSQNSQGYKNVVKPIEFTGFISSCAHGSGRSSTDRQFYYVNSRPCEPPKIMKAINDIYRQYNPNQYPFVFLNLNIERLSVDINLTPDKRKIYMSKEKIILDTLKNTLLKLFESIPRTLNIESKVQLHVRDDLRTNSEQPKTLNTFLKQFSTNSKLKSVNKDLEEKPDLKRKSTSMLDYVSKHKKNSDTKSDDIDQCEDKILLEKDNESIGDNNTADIPEERNNTPEKVKSIINKENISEKNNGDIMYLDYNDKMPETQIKNLEDVVIQKSHTIYCKPKSHNNSPIATTKAHTSAIGLNNTSMKKNNKIVTDKEDLGKYHRKSVVLKTSMDHVKQLNYIYQKNVDKCIPEKNKFKGTINPINNKTCEEELSKEISKQSFKEMRVIGQFNLGFIITQLDNDLFIIDQHATDEIYNFEMLQKTIELTSQKLVVPQSLELTGVNEQILMDNLDTFKRNGFTFKIDQDASPTKRVSLLTIPMSKNWIFGKEDIEELLFMLREFPSENCRPSRVCAMFASRACRKSVMIGTALSKADMKKLVLHMAEIEKPWNCPHGRPTIRHLINLGMVHTKE